jgi:hypothetical protein
MASTNVHYLPLYRQNPYYESERRPCIKNLIIFYKAIPNEDPLKEVVNFKSITIWLTIL